ncbi:uncharacterized protein EV420DRAFT_808464 [Desarmillaria tabescens]|uniref:Uncharacterized protein n=1 Tax=Armillaria tabescens TaxID=1929756 RepID=A0AA39NIG4_ARMTA|nr:uncharacterized protein EV420DRAFT_808464 [Desarmillaria tabescens]KAK0466058.1 hypothetical protein EV420DRAFT_808464 [Desarmillaria tabescens]
MIIVIIVLYITTCANLSLDWLIVRTALVSNGKNLMTKFANFENPLRWITVVTGVIGAVCTVLVDATMIWRCWLVWGRRWQVVLLPTLCLIAAPALKMYVTSQQYSQLKSDFRYLLLYASLTLATTLWCTLLLIYRVLTVTQGAEGAGAYRHVIEVLVESSALYAVSLVLYVAVFARGSNAFYYLDPIAGITRGIAPTLLVGRVAAGHARADDSWHGSVMTSPLRFGQDKTGNSSQQDSVVTRTGYGFEDDLEARPERESGSGGDEREEGSSDKMENQSEEAIVELRR